MRWIALLPVLCAVPAVAAPTGLNTIPTVDIVPLRNFVIQAQNGNTSLNRPTLFESPHPALQAQIALNSRIEAGVDWAQPSDLTHNALVLNVKDLLLQETTNLPGLAVGMQSLASGQRAGFYLTVAKTLNYEQQQRERFRAHHRRNRKLLGRRVHAGLMVDEYGSIQPFLGTDLQLSEHAVFQADWINGAGNAVTAGVAIILSDQRTVINPAFLFSNSTHRIDGFYINVGHQFSF